MMTFSMLSDCLYVCKSLSSSLKTAMPRPLSSDLIITATAFFAKIIIVDIVFLLATITYTFTIFSHFTVAKGTNSRIAVKTLQQDTN